MTGAVYICGGPAAGRLDVESDCPERWQHLLMPVGMLEAMGWAEDIQKTHTCRRCPGCDLWLVWRPRTRFIRLVERGVNDAIAKHLGPEPDPWIPPEPQVVGPGVYVRLWGDLLDPAVAALGRRRFHVSADPEQATLCVLGRWPK